MAILDYSRGLNAAGPETTMQGVLKGAGQLQGLRHNEQVMQQQQQQQQQAQAQAQAEGEARQEGAELLKSGTPEQVANFGMMHPEIMKDYIEAVDWRDSTAKKTRLDYSKNILSGNVSPRPALLARIAEVEADGGDASGLKQTLQLDDAGIVAAAEKDFAVLATEEFQAWKKSTSDEGTLSDKPSAVLETEWFNEQSEEVQETHLKIKRGENPTLDEKLVYEKSKADIKEDSVIRAAREKTKDQRRQGYIDSGVASADNLLTVNRSIELLDGVATGGIDNAIIRAKQTFGIESGDEAELSYELGKSVLKQLKPTFGAAFTVNEMLELKRMEAGLGKSVAGNRRILANLAKVIERSASRGARAALSLNDTFAADEINMALSSGKAKSTSAKSTSAKNPDVPEISDQDLLNKYGG